MCSDSKYCIDGIEVSLQVWQHSGWRTSTGSKVSNRDLWEEARGVLGHCQGRLHCVYIRGHINEVGNGSADELPDEGRLKPPGRLKYLVERLSPFMAQRAKLLKLSPPVVMLS